MTRSWNNDEKITIAQGFRIQWEEAQNCHVLLFPEGMIQLNPTAAEILVLCDGTQNISGIIDQLQKKYPDVNLSKDINEFLEDVYAKGWITDK